MPKSPEQFDFSKQENQEKFEKLSKIKKERYIDISHEEALKINEGLGDREKLDEESYQNFFEKKLNYPIDDPDYYEKKETDPSVKQYIIKNGVVPALIHEKWDHDTDLKSLENVVKYCYENNIYGKTLETAIDLITSKKRIAKAGSYYKDYLGDKEEFYKKGLIKSTQDENEIWGGEVSHIIGHFHSEIYKTGRKDLAKKLNDYCVEGALNFKNINAGKGSMIFSALYYNPIIYEIKNTGKNPLPFKESGFDNKEFLELLKNYGNYYSSKYDVKEAKEMYQNLMTIKHFDETGELLPQKEIKEPEEITEGAYVDIDGTLVIGENQLNQKLVAKLYEYKNQGKKVTIFTAGDIRGQLKRLRKLGLSVGDPKIHINEYNSEEDKKQKEELSRGDFDIARKDEYVGKKLEITIDDFSQEQLKNILGIFSKEHHQI